ncbi:MAG: hypothetical protein KAS07_01755 [Candidatus Pacebacteria bacterium]|nr:hypothetical protein [Candidatus Paceibacterota bacterium]
MKKFFLLCISVLGSFLAAPFSAHAASLTSEAKVSSLSEIFILFILSCLGLCAFVFLFRQLFSQTEKFKTQSLLKKNEEELEETLLKPQNEIEDILKNNYGFYSEKDLDGLKAKFARLNSRKERVKRLKSFLRKLFLRKLYLSYEVLLDKARHIHAEGYYQKYGYPK